jgi:3'(2'), 5'-bisphosphate nucleotidase
MASACRDAMNLEPWQREFDVALGAVREGAMLARDIRQRIGEHALLKADRSPVTVADFSVQALVAHRLHQAFPDDPLVAEEDSASLQVPDARLTLQSVLDVIHRAVPDLAADQVLEAIDRGRGTPGERFWTLDPVDGTRGFVRGDQYVVALALIMRGCVEIGLLGCPQLALTDERRDAVGSIVHAVRNHGAFRASLTGGELAPLRVSSRREPRMARVLRSFESEHIDVDTFNEIIRTLRVEAAPTLMDSQAKHAVIAAGRADLLIRLPATPEYREKIWDQAAGTLIIEEAGGRVTDMRGAALDFGAGRVLASNEGVIASNGCLHVAVLDALRSVTGRA